MRVDGSEFKHQGATEGRTTLCVRPESLRFDCEQNRFAVSVESVEFLGDAYRVHCDWNGRDVLVKTRHAPPTGEAVLGFDPADATLL